jgi:N-acetylglucosamine-6-phosphate deacetylase
MAKNICLHNGTVVTGYTVLEECAVLVGDGKIVEVFNERRFKQKTLPSSTEVYDVAGAYITPGFIDEHIHGFRGFGTDDGREDSILAMSENLAAYGVSGFCPTLYSQSEDEMKRSIRACVSAMGREKGARILGIHLEGPFISKEKPGVQRPEFIRPVDLALMDELYESAEGRILTMTVAPELKGMRELALSCVAKGITLKAGHTNATYENIVEGMQAGILHSTHIFNAMSGMHHRNPNAVGAILIFPEMACEVIADGHHVHPDLIKLLMREKPVSKIVLVTDALKPAEQETGPLFANEEEVILDGGVFYRKSDKVMAGSSLTMIKGIKNLCAYGISIEHAVKMASSNPARILGFQKRGTLVPGYDADITVFDKNFTVLASIIGGEFKKFFS